MPGTYNLRVRNAHRYITRPPLLSCSFADCSLTFRSKNALTKHLRTAHSQSSDPIDLEPESQPGPSHILPPVDSGEARLQCPFQCNILFKNKAGLTKHVRTHHAAPEPEVESSTASGPAPSSNERSSQPPVRHEGHFYYDSDSDNQATHVTSPVPGSPILSAQYNDDLPFDHDSLPQASERGSSPFYHNNSSPPRSRNSTSSRDIPTASVKRIYHPLIDGKHLV
jgi:uncharacterized C2H2 Zn-finger protein